MRSVVAFVLFFALLKSATLAQNLNKVAHPEPVTDFEISGSCFGDTTYFTNLTIRADEFYWTIFELTVKNLDTTYKSVFSSVDSNIKFRFPLKGLYKVVLIGDNGHQVSKSRFINVDSNPLGNFDYDQCTGKFTNLSACAQRYRWDFGDGINSQEKSPVHFYSQTKEYAVKLKVYSASNDSAIFEKKVNITALNNTTLNPAFSYTVTKDQVDFTTFDTSSGNFTTFQWSFGDQVVFTLKGDAGRKVKHSFSRKDTTYLVFLVVKSGCAVAYSTRSVFIPDSTPVEKTKIYPNPVSGNTLKLEVENKQNLKGIYLSNCFGKQLTTFGIKETIKGYELTLDELQKGVYFITLHYSNGYKRYHFIKG